ncbi:MFS transporter [Pseudomonas fakonensis]|uniref:MFS transporter n=1 Tax=Pseudomonas fakonensis TaxID=2842355 RepID=A0ABX8N0Y7_9PSED|nr:MFS transporter [Pseudomonas fakonensis]QXH49585.1 MFS transporter [Pseudomonas fakonensis]
MPAPSSQRLFALFCFASFLLSLSYGTTFLLAKMLAAHGGSESDAGLVISSAMLSTFVAVICCGHLSDRIGAPRTIAGSALLLAAACLGFAWAPAQGNLLLAFGLLLGLGWGTFYTLGPIVVAMTIEPARRMKYFALLSGSMMTGIGSGPLTGRAFEALGLPLESAFLSAAAASLLGGLLFRVLAAPLTRAGQGPVSVSKLSPAAVLKVMASPALFPIIMVGLGGAIFGGLSSFQTSYAALRLLDYSLFFLGFTCAAIGCRLLVAGLIVKRDPYVSACVLSGLMVLAVLMLGLTVHSAATYLLAAITLGVGYGLTYSVINGQAANQAPAGHMAQALVLFSLAYFVGVFGFPWLAGQVIVQAGMPALLQLILLLAVVNWGIAVARLGWRWWVGREVCEG